MFIIKKNRIVIVTGVSQGIGFAIASAFLENGDVVFGCALPLLADSPNLQALQQRYSEHFFYSSIELTQPHAIHQFVQSVVQQAGRIDIVISNAGRNMFKGINCSAEDWQHNLDLNLSSHWQLANAAQPALKKSRGVIVVITSNHAYYTVPGCAPYNISKGALLSLVQSLAIEWGADIRTVGIAPGYIDTEGGRLWFDEQSDPAGALERVNAMHPVGRMGTPEEVAHLCLFLSSDLAAFISGTTITIDGGRGALMQDH